MAPPARVAVPEARSYILVDADTGRVIAGYHEHLRLPPASLTKVLTALIAVGYLRPGTGIAGTAVSEAAYPNLANMEPGVAWPLDEVLQALLVYSANDSAYAIAQKVGGSLAGFETDMARAAAQLGMTDHPRFTDPSGLDGSLGFGAGNLVSARDLAIAGRALLHVPELAAIVREHMAVFVDPLGTPHALPSMNSVFLNSYPGAIGIKTGFTDLAGSCIMAAARRHGRTMLAVVMNGYNPQQTAMDLLDEGFATPVRQESTNDVLPPVHLPTPYVARPGSAGVAGKELRGPAHPAHKPVKARAAGPAGNKGGLGAPGSTNSAQNGTGAQSAAKGAAPATRTSQPGRTAAPSRVNATGPAGLGAVLGSWFGKLLLLLSVAAGGAALSERGRERRARQQADLEKYRAIARSAPPARPGYRVVRDGQDSSELHRVGR